MHELLPARLGAPELTLMDLFGQNQREKRNARNIQTIQQWVVCFNAFMSVVAIRQPERVRNLLAHFSLITKASADYEGTPWLSYDAHFRRIAAATSLNDWSQVDASIWTQYFGKAKLAGGKDTGLAIIPVQEEAMPFSMLDKEKVENDGRHNENSNRSGGYRPDKFNKKDNTRWKPYSRQKQPICLRWNMTGCREATCTYQHICLECHYPDHRLSECPRKVGKAYVDYPPHNNWRMQGQSFCPAGEGPRK